MTLTCPRCHRSLSTDEGGDAPSYCMYCGHRLRPDANPAQMQTGSYDPSNDGEGEAPATPELAPQSVGGYRLLRSLGSGGMGTVYEAETPGTGQRVAVKLLSSRLASSPASVERFRQEGRLASQIAHPRCVFVLSADTDAGRPYIVMELMPGETLKDIVDKNGPLSSEAAITRILDVIDGLAEAHRVGMIHRDMKPSNCFLTADDRVKVGDFGLSKSLIGTRDHQLTQSGAFLGTVLFASPEQIRGEPLDYGSDIYSVCATLYYLLCGEAPHHHESVTAALAKVISEEPPSIREKRPEVSRGLEAVVMKGLERDREHRWQSLDDLRDALVNLLPSRRHPARPRALIGAYFLDRIVLAFLTAPLLIVRVSLSGTHNPTIDPFELSWFSLLVMHLYFAFGDGVFGATPGKWLLGLRVSRMGQTEPPGFWRALLRTTIFHAMIVGVFLVPDPLVRLLGPAAGGVLGGIVFLLGSAALLSQLRKKWAYRGLHDFASDCHVTQRPLPPRRMRLAIRQPSPLQSLLPALADPLPPTIGAYRVRGRIAVHPSGEEVWVGEDRALARTVLISLKPRSDAVLPMPEAFRPTRLRRLGEGAVEWADRSFHWSAFAAPLGGPLIDAVQPNRPLPWADARYLLDQLVEEFRIAETDGTTPPELGIDQVWVEPNGRVQLLDFPTTNVPRAERTPIVLLREVVSLALEGRPRATEGPVRAPVPPHAVAMLDKLFTDGGYGHIAELQRDLAETHIHRPEVTPAIRAAQLGVQAALVSSLVVLLFGVAAAPGPYQTVIAQERANQGDAALALLGDAEKRGKLAADHPSLTEPLKSPRLIQRIEEFRDRKRAEAELRRARLLGLQRWVLEQREEHAPRSAEELAGYPVQVRELIQWAGAPEHTPRGKAESPWGPEAAPLFAALLAIPLAFGLSSVVLRGGAAMLIAGLAIVRADGRRATRMQCGLRALVVWLPITLLLLGVATLQVTVPERIHLALALWLLAIALLPVYIVVALRLPSRPPQDRVARTYLVPA
jgi:serine/threonine protein kinase